MLATHTAKRFAKLVLLAGFIAGPLAAGAQDAPTDGNNQDFDFPD